MIGRERSPKPARAEPRSRADLSVQRAQRTGVAPSAGHAPADGSSSPADPVATSTKSAAVPGLIVDDGTAKLEPGQMQRSAFLNTLRAEVTATADACLSGTIYSVIGCPWIDKWFSYYSGQSAEQIERAVHRFAPGAQGAKDARAYIAPITARVRSAIASWSSGETSEDGPAGDASAEAPGDPSSGGAAMKERPGGALIPPAPRALRAQLGDGEPLGGESRTRMETAFRRDLGHVRMHTDAHAAAMADKMNARAFAVGDHIALPPGESTPGTLAGDALLAHEVAHVLQQQGASQRTPLSPGYAEQNALENDADRAAVGAVASLWGRADLAGDVGPSQRATLGLRSCKSDRQKEIERLGGLQFDHLEKKRKEEEETQRKAAEEEAKKKGQPMPTVAPTVSMDDILTKETNVAASPNSPTDEWTKLPGPAQAKWKADAKDAWDKVVASVKGTELENVMKGKSYSFDPEPALKNGWYAYQTSGVYHVSMWWVKDVKVNPKNVWPNVAHEMGGHDEYGTNYAGEIMKAAMEKMTPEERKKWQEDPVYRQQFHDMYEYPETEIYSALRERRYSKPEDGSAEPVYGGLRPDQNVPDKLGRMKKGLEPSVAKAVLAHLAARIDASAEILARDKLWFRSQCTAVFGYAP